MPQPKLESISIALSKVVGDEVFSAYADGKTFTAADRLDAINRARQLVYVEALIQSQGKIALAYPELVKSGIKQIFPEKEPDIRIAMKVRSGNKVYERIPAIEYMEVRYGQYSKWKPGKALANISNYCQILPIQDEA